MKRRRGTCRQCSMSRPLTALGKLLVHRLPGGTVCRGSGQDPAEADQAAGPTVRAQDLPGYRSHLLITTEAVQRLRAHRLRLGMTILEVAARTGRPEGTIRSWERGERLPDLDAQAEYAAALGLQMSVDIAFEPISDSVTALLEAGGRPAPASHHIAYAVERAAQRASRRSDSSPESLAPG